MQSILQWLTDKPYQAIWSTIPMIAFLSFLQTQMLANSVVDFQIQSVEIPLFTLNVASAFILGMIGALYWWRREIQLVNWMTFVHVIATIFATLNLAGAFMFPHILLHFFPGLYKSIMLMTETMWWIAIVSQFLFVVNLGLSFTNNQDQG